MTKFSQRLGSRAIVCLTPFLAFMGCGVQSKQTVTVALQGGVHGGQQPVSGASIQLYAVNVLQYGGPSTPLLTQAVTTDANGGFSITGNYGCPSASTLVYVTATGGNPGIASGNNAQLALAAALGPCGNLSRSSFVSVNELTTVAAVYALTPYINSVSAAGSTATESPQLASSFSLAAELVNVQSGTAPGTGVPAGVVVPVATLNTIADIIAPCINSSGDVSGGASPCGQLLALATLPGSPAPTDVTAALINLARQPSLNTQPLFGLITSAAPFEPALLTAPADLSINLIVPIPVLSQVSPTSVMAGSGGFSLQLTGSAFLTGSTVFWNQTPLALQSLSASQITALVPATLIAASGTASLVVLTPGAGQSASLVIPVNAPTAALSQLSPQAIPVGPPAQITVGGAGFIANSVAQLGGSSRPTTFLNSSTLQVSLTASDTATAGTGQISVVNPAPGGGTTTALPLVITSLPIPTITNVVLSLS
jgi:hypothetical protein